MRTKSDVRTYYQIRMLAKSDSDYTSLWVLKRREKEKGEEGRRERVGLFRFRNIPYPRLIAFLPQKIEC